MASTGTRNTAGSGRAVSADTCPGCGRPHNLAAFYREPTLCGRCGEIRRRANWWANAGGQALVERCALIGIGPQFCRSGQAPSYADPGLSQRLATNPLPKGGLLIVGPCGAHKTHLAAARTVDAARRGWTAQLVNWNRLALEVRDSYARRPARRTELEIIDAYAKLDYLAIDDLGVGRARARETSAVLKLAYDLLDARYCAAKTTDLTTNLTPDELAGRFDARVWRRIRELTTPYVMLLDEGGE